MRSRYNVVMLKQVLNYRQTPFGFFSTDRYHLKGRFVCNSVCRKIAQISNHIDVSLHTGW